MLSSHVPTTTLFFLLWNSNCIVSHLLYRGCTWPWPRQRKDQIREQAGLLLDQAGNEIGLPSPASGASFLPAPHFVLCTSWSCKPFPPVRGLREWAECSCRLVLVSLDQGTLSPYLKTDSKAKLHYKSSSVLKVDSLSKDWMVPGQTLRGTKIKGTWPCPKELEGAVGEEHV